ncbi:MAG: hypothetical protein OHK0039_33730 [Bacteroidia bacterium]
MRSTLRMVIGYLQAHLHEDFRWGYYLSAGGFLLISLLLNYYLIPGKTVEVWMVFKLYEQERLMLAYMLFYGLPYGVSVVLYAAFHRRWDIFRQREFWLRSLFILAVLSFDAGFYYLRLLLRDMDGPTLYVMRKYASNLSSALSAFIPLLLFYLWRDRQEGSFYGLRLQRDDLRPYLWLLLAMVPVVAGASFTEGFQDYYPSLKPERAARWDGLPLWATMAIFEFVYAFDFIWTELLFRGFMVIGMVRVLGTGAVLPMAAVYCYRHFAKPFGEAASSIIGGYILGVMALHSRHIMGGILIHVGIALLMEFFAILHRL